MEKNLSDAMGKMESKDLDLEKDLDLDLELEERIIGRRKEFVVEWECVK
jgi:hypothetical protein